MSRAPTATPVLEHGEARLAYAGAWTIEAGARLEGESARALAGLAGAGAATLDLSALEALDTAGAWVIARSQGQLAAAGRPARIVGARAEHATLLEAAAYTPSEAAPAPTRDAASLVADMGESVYLAGRDALGGLDFLGRIVAVGVRAMLSPRRWRITSTVYHLETMGLRGAPLILMINFFVGVIVAQQGVIQLARFGASGLTVDLVAILTLRELGVMLTSIMVAGRSGSAITAELGAMNMREEIDALRVMALDPLEALVLPRLTALVVALPLLTFLGDLAALTGGMLVSWAQAGVSPQAFWAELQYPASIERFAAGLTKAPFMALAIGVIACMEGFAVQGSAESLGKRVTSSVVKSIFTVILLDGVFAMFYAAVKF
jgi:phospholipid/cholesterol/gamma-HCH transport system permease protein